MIIRLFKALRASERQAFIIAGVLCAAALITTLYSAFIARTTIAPARGGEYTEGMVGQPVALNPMHIGSTALDRELIPALFADLATLSQSIATSTTGKVWIVTLKDDLVWSDGKAITADDVIFTVHTIQRPDADSPLWASWQGVTAERASQREIRFTLKSNYSYFSDSLRTLRIAPAHAFESIPATNIRLSDYNLKPITSGPYTFTNFEKRIDGFITEYHLSANNAYAGSRALIENVNIRFFPSYNDAIMAFNRKQIQGLGGVDASSLNDIKINHRLHEIATPQYYALFFNTTGHPALKDKAIRSALVRAIDRAELIEQIMAHRAYPTFGPLPFGTAGYDESVYTSSSSLPLTAASSSELTGILTKQGWMPSVDGVRAKNTGKTSLRLEFEITVPDLPLLVKTANLIKIQWQKIGVRATIRTVSPAEIQATIIKPRAYQMLLFGNVLRGNSDLFSFWDSSQRFDPGLNLALYSNAAVDKAIATTRSTFNTAERYAALALIQRQLLADQPAAFLFSPYYLYLSPTSLGGLTTTMAKPVEERLARINEWFLETDRIFK